MATYMTPNVYVEEKSVLPPSVAAVSTAIPAFIGYTERAKKDGEDLQNIPTRINTFLEYESIFGGAPDPGISVAVDTTEKITVTNAALKFLLYYSMRIYFDNGGSSCYVVSVGDYSSTTVAKSNMEDGLKALEKEDEPTIIILTDGPNLDTDVDYTGLCQQSLLQCGKLKDRFAIFDVLDGDGDPTKVGAFRSGIGMNHLKYGAAYYPYIKTTLNYEYNDKTVTVTIPNGSTAGSIATAPSNTSPTDPAPAPSTTSGANTLNSLKTTKTQLYGKILAEISKKRVTLPPSSAIAAVYSTVDRERGVWKAPANVSLASVIGPTIKITNDDQETLNVDTTAGKSINAIRSFTGKGTLVWGARTLAGNDNEWRYIPVRRLFSTIEESIQKSTAFAVFEPNTPMTWLKVKTMIESYLDDLWRQGALAGAKAEQAFYAHVGLGSTMTEQDILDGRMIVKVGIAAVRPAEFIILEFSHKLQES